jgi:Ni,Fe-hydrogenase I cytochrome b subunit
MGIWNQIKEYLFIKKRDPDRYTNSFVKYMNGMNRISLFIFLIAVIIMLVKFLIIPLFH